MKKDCSCEVIFGKGILAFVSLKSNNIFWFNPDFLLKILLNCFQVIELYKHYIAQEVAFQVGQV